jgi:hypothetical protein
MLDLTLFLTEESQLKIKTAHKGAIASALYEYLSHGVLVDTDLKLLGVTVKSWRSISEPTPPVYYNYAVPKLKILAYSDVLVTGTYLEMGDIKAFVTNVLGIEVELENIKKSKSVIKYSLEGRLIFTDHPFSMLSTEMLTDIMYFSTLSDAINVHSRILRPIGGIPSDH